MSTDSPAATRVSGGARKGKRPSAFAVALEICLKDLRIERRTGEIVTTAGVFAVLVGFLASAAFKPEGVPPDVGVKIKAGVASGTIWVTLFFASMLSFGRVWQREREESALVGLLVAPIPRASIYLGKAIATFGMILLVEIPLVVLCAFLFQVDAIPLAGPLAGFLLMGTFAIALLGTLFGAMTVRTRARDLVLAIVLFPLLSPILLCGAVGTRLVFEHQVYDEYSGWLGFMALFDFVSLMISVALFGPLVDD